MKIFRRQACAIESAAKWNVNRDIFVLHAAKVGFQPEDTIAKALQSYPNIHFRTLNLYKFVGGTLAEGWMKDDQFFSSDNFAAHLLNLLRLVTLYKFGGVHLDMDFIIQRNFRNFSSNFAVIDDENSFRSNSVLGIHSNYVGRNLAEDLLRFNFIINF